MTAARAWLADGRQAAAHVCQRRYPYGHARVCAYAGEMGVPIPDAYAGRASDVATFLDAAAALLKESAR